MTVPDKIAEYLAAHGPSHASEIQHNCNLTKGKVQYALRNDDRFQQGEASKWSLKKAPPNPHEQMLHLIEDKINANIKEQQKLGTELKSLRTVAKYHRAAIGPPKPPGKDTPFTLGIAILSNISDEPLTIKHGNGETPSVIVVTTAKYIPIRDQMQLQDLKWQELGRTTSPEHTHHFIYYFE